ncbi:chromosome partitioning protein ParA [Vibrio sp.]|uniref:Chromosome partitioning protein ParA n=1 Tax=Vibrio viridaestus TaxID=2487322 RepID=A0A3N9TJ51_9VIBR|nr:chromosome partitioning protein ParA [Vibrio viridaestus]MDC0610303.1 chromosome partitioning protein ParA [Vibrio sp.]RQW64368.1 chromosome partitioning protein ParA [Vibrio viridaestus]
MTDWVPDNVLMILAVNLGLLILLVWFIILLLIIREFRKFARQVGGNSPQQDKTLSLCQESVDNAINYTSANAETINQLMAIQQALEAQINHFSQTTNQNISDEDRKTIESLNQQLDQSYKLIKRLKANLDRSVKGLKVTRGKLYSQYETVDELKAEKEEIEKNFAQLEQEYIRIAQSVEQQKQAAAGAGGEDSTAQSKQVQAMRQELESMQAKLQHVEKEKNFIEKRYLDMMNEVEGKD